ncbi:MAG: hypothetical protein ABIR13_03265 [Polaromonas sp.]
MPLSGWLAPVNHACAGIALAKKAATENLEKNQAALESSKIDAII